MIRSAHRCENDRGHPKFPYQSYTVEAFGRRFLKRFNIIFGIYCNLLLLYFVFVSYPLSISMISQFQLKSPMKKKIMNMFTSSEGGKTAKVFLVVLAIYALIALVTYLVW